MYDAHTQDVSNGAARRLIQRAIDKAEQLGLSGGLAVVGASGALISASRMDRGGPGGMTRARSKAWISATQQVPSAEHLKRMNFIAAPVAAGFTKASPEALFPGAGGMPIYDGELVIGGIAASGATVSPFIPAGVDPQTMIADGVAANPEDMLIHYALELPYVGQHGDDHARWVAQFGEFPADAGSGLGMVTAPRASHQHEHDWAIRLADAVIAEAMARAQRITLAIVDHRGDPIQQDAMDGAPTSASFISLATAATAATFQEPSDKVGSTFAGSLDQLGRALPYPILTIEGGLPIEEDGAVVGGLAVAGASPRENAELVRFALANFS